MNGTSDGNKTRSHLFSHRATGESSKNATTKNEHMQCILVDLLQSVHVCITRKHHKKLAKPAE